jgi:hypothetical protein
MVDTTWTYSHHTLVATGAGYELTTYTDSLWLSRNGLPINDPVIALFSEAVIVSVIDSGGTVTEIRGYDEVFDRIDATLDPTAAAAVRQALAPEILAEKEAEEWNELIGRFSGVEMSLGQIIYDTLSTAVTRDITLTTFTGVQLLDTLRVDTFLCALLRVSGYTDPYELAVALGVLPEEVVSKFALNDSLVDFYANQQITSERTTEMVVEIATLSVHSEESRREMSAMIAMGGGPPVYSGMIETQIKRFTFD